MEAAPRSFSAERAGVVVRGDLAGEEGRPTVLFVHGYSQARSCWDRQLYSSLVGPLALARYDLRGHGDSDRPDDRASYGLDAFAGELESVIEAVHAELEPSALVLCAWSFGARIALRLLDTRDSETVDGLVLVGAVANDDPALIGPGLRQKQGMVSSDLAENEEATRRFLEACFVTLPDDASFEELFEENMRVTPFVRGAMSGHDLRPIDLRAHVRVPVLIAHGRDDQVVLAAAALLSEELFDQALLSLYDQVGHAPFLEDPARFNGELRRFCAELEQRGA
jgi:pimeloyl-ACP methyl ester carboxylesterase